MLRGTNADTAVALLGRHLAFEDRRLAAPVLFERIDADLEDLRAEGYDLPRTAQAYCAEWRTQGVLVRRATDEAREETLELSPGALTAIRFVTELAEPRQSVTESRLATIQDRLRALARDTDPDTSARLVALHAERDRISEQIDRVESGEAEVLPPDRALEMIRDILSLVEEVPADFARVRTELEQLNRTLRERLIEQEGSRGSVLEDIFRGVDLLAESDAGRSFSGFYALLLDPERGLEFEEDLAAVVDRDFTAALSVAQVRTLRRLLPTLQDRGAEIHTVLTTFSRSLRRFVQSQELQHERQLNRQLRAGLREALAAADTVRPFARTGLELDLTSMPLSSVAALKLHNPGDFETDTAVVSHAEDPLDVGQLLALARASDIDMAELESNVDDVVSRHGAATIAEVLGHHAATQGVASVVGLLVLAQEHGTALGGREDVAWDGRHGTVDRYLFTERITA